MSDPSQKANNLVDVNASDLFGDGIVNQSNLARAMIQKYQSMEINMNEDIDINSEPSSASHQMII